jgi:hypothetical protein
VQAEPVKSLDELFAVAFAGTAKNPVAYHGTCATTALAESTGASRQTKTKRHRADLLHLFAENNHSIAKCVFICFWCHICLPFK